MRVGPLVVAGAIVVEIGTVAMGTAEGRPG